MSCLTEAEVAATAAAATTIAASHDAADQEECLACWRRDNKVRIDILLAKLFGNVEAQ